MINVYFFDSEQQKERFGGILAALEERSGPPVRRAEWRLEKTLAGKPFFPRHPETGISISDSGRYWICVLADQAVGADLQKLELRPGEDPGKSAARIQKIADRFFHPAEAAYVRQTGRRGFFEVWTAKEAYVKYTGTGIDNTFSSFCTLSERGEEQPVAALGDRVTGAFHRAAGVCFEHFEMPAGYLLCLSHAYADEIRLIRMQRP